LTKEVNPPSKLGTFETKLLLTKALLNKNKNENNVGQSPVISSKFEEKEYRSDKKK
jgi:hypothetical protein